jgi:hypothetical protein
MPQPFKTFSEAVNALPLFIGGLDLVGQHETIDDLAFLVQHEIDLYEDGESNTIAHPSRPQVTLNRLRRCQVFIERCHASRTVGK